MSLLTNQAELARILAAAEAVLGEPCLPLRIDWDVLTHLTSAAPRPRIRGISELPAIRNVCSESPGHGLEFGIEQYRVGAPDGVIPVVHVINPLEGCGSLPTDDLWVVAAQNYRRLYRFLRRAVRQQYTAVPPLMKPADRQKLWQNTIGFLQRGEEALVRFGVPVKRGVMLLGAPGNGKTMAARWLMSEARRQGLEWRHITVECYETACTQGMARQLFELQRPGVVLFDDFYHGLQNRSDDGATRDRSMLLSELDGVQVRSGVIYLFTCNLEPSELDPAIRRPGRIDLFLRFPKPDGELRRQFIEQNWPSEALAGIDVNEATELTTGCSFADLAELKKLLVLRFLEQGEWDWGAAWSEFQQRMAEDQSSRVLGFAAAAPQRQNGTVPNYRA
ncbi:MAG: ATP-binding protein [Planctomycetaceae bacterium]